MFRSRESFGLPGRWSPCCVNGLLHPRASFSKSQRVPCLSQPLVFTGCWRSLSRLRWLAPAPRFPRGISARCWPTQSLRGLDAGGGAAGVIAPRCRMAMVRRAPLPIFVGMLVVAIFRDSAHGAAPGAGWRVRSQGRPARGACRARREIGDVVYRGMWSIARGGMGWRRSLRTSNRHLCFEEDASTHTTEERNPSRLSACLANPSTSTLRGVLHQVC